MRPPIEQPTERGAGAGAERERERHGDKQLLAELNCFVQGHQVFPFGAAIRDAAARTPAAIRSIHSAHQNTRKRGSIFQNSPHTLSSRHAAH
jgi:hypothetical protein